MAANPLVAVYDLTVNPLTFDFSYFLSIAVCESNRRGLGGKIYVVILGDGFRDIAVEGQFSEIYRERRLRSIILPLIQLCNFAVGHAVARSLSEGMALISSFSKGYSFFPAMADRFMQRSSHGKPQWVVTPMVPMQLEIYYSHGFFPKQPIFSVSAELLSYYAESLGPRRVLFHVRDSPFNSYRNTPPGLFEGVASLCEEIGFHCSIVADVDNLLASRSLFPAPAECLSIELRLAAALAAKFNVVWSTGVVSPFYFSEAKFMMFGFYKESGAISSRAFFEKKGPKFGVNPVWLNPDTQVFDWTDADELTMHAVFSAISDRLING